MEEAPLADVNNNGILDDDEAAAYKAHAASGKFKQQLAYGVGAAMVFGLFTAISQALFRSAFGGAVAGAAGTTAAATAGTAATGAAALSFWPIVGLVAIAAIGIGCLYLSAKFLSENTLHDQDLQARQILAAQGRGPSITEEITAPTPTFPAAQAAKTEETALPATDGVSAARWTDKFPARTAAAATPSNANDNDQSWGEKITAARSGAAVSPPTGLSAL